MDERRLQELVFGDARRSLSTGTELNNQDHECRSLTWCSLAPWTPSTKRTA